MGAYKIVLEDNKDLTLAVCNNLEQAQGLLKVFEYKDEILESLKGLEEIMGKDWKKKTKYKIERIEE